MSERHAIDLLLATLLVTTFTSVGALALWVATSSRHWFARVAAAFVIFSPLLLVPAYGRFLTFGLATSLVVGGIGMYRLWRLCADTKHGEINCLHTGPQSRWQFSIKSAFAAFTCLAVLCALVVKIPLTTWAELPVIATSAFSVAILTLLAAWIVDGKGTLRERCGSAIAIAVILTGGALLAAKDSLPVPPPLDIALAPFLATIDDQFRSSLPEALRCYSSWALGRLWL